MTFKEDENKEIRKVLKDDILQEKEGSPWLLCGNLGKKLAGFAAAEHWKDWEKTHFPELVLHSKKCMS